MLTLLELTHHYAVQLVVQNVASNEIETSART